MGLNFSQSTTEQIGAVAALMQESFHVPAEALSLDRDYLNWKYYAAGPAWPGSRSYILSDGERIVAHAAIWPIALQLQDGVRHGLGFGDWVASEAHRGAGLLLLKKLVTLGSFVLVTGGAEITRQILPRMGFQHWADRQRYVRILRPIKQAWTRPDRVGWKEPLRLIRNTAWSLRSLAPVAGWTAKEMEPDERVLSLAQGQQGSVHTHSFVRWLLGCPVVSFHFLGLHERGVLKGYCVLGVLRGQARIADLRIASEQRDDWSAALAAVLCVVCSNTAICEVIAMGSVAKLDQALVANGFSPRGQFPLVVFDSEARMSREPVPQLGMLEDDASTVYDLEHPFVS